MLSLALDPQCCSLLPAALLHRMGTSNWLHHKKQQQLRLRRLRPVLYTLSSQAVDQFNHQLFKKDPFVAPQGARIVKVPPPGDFVLIHMTNRFAFCVLATRGAFQMPLSKNFVG